MPQHLQMTLITLKGFATTEAVPCKFPTTLMQQPPSVSRLHDFQLGRTKNSLDTHQYLWFLGGTIKQLLNAGHGSKKHPELKRAVNCDKKSGADSLMNSTCLSSK